MMNKWKHKLTNSRCFFAWWSIRCSRYI